MLSKKSRILLVLILCIPISIISGFWFLRYDIQHTQPFGSWPGIEKAKEELYEQHKERFALLVYGILAGVTLTIFERRAIESYVFIMLLLGFLSLLVEHVFAMIPFSMFLSPTIFLMMLGRKIVKKQFHALHLPIFGLLLNGYFLIFAWGYFSQWWGIFGD